MNQRAIERTELNKILALVAEYAVTDGGKSKLLALQPQACVADVKIRLKKTEEALSEIYRNAQLALQSISNILPEVEDHETRLELERQHEEYEHFSAKAAMIAKDRNIELKEPGPIKKAMMWGSIKMNTMTDNSRAHIAEMMVQGTVMGITALRTTLGEVPEDGNDEIIALLEEMLRMEEDYEKKWKEYL